ncbi:hypothetical protein BJG93_36940 (plasmid) [Paraburkholderia sprentiae WSM5005]|uniref:Transposase n=1 Tax=Paraburkholderia sprentiae WSM5005 TaxID=754502 RepID=A0A8F4KIV3_9BURK|nr:hypothetical protein BJG93_36940 [Paraburkholderia sprentiae WSM5005]
MHLHPAYRWFYRESLNGAAPKQATSSDNRHGRFLSSSVLHHTFEMALDCACHREEQRAEDSRWMQ